MFGYKQAVMRYLLLSFLILACSSSDNVEGPSELVEAKVSASGFTVDTPEEELLNEGKSLYERGLYSIAKEAFQALKDGYPNSPWVDFAAVKIADSSYESGEFADAKQAFENFVADKPTSPEAPYALFRAGRASEEQFTGVGRDPTPIKQAKEIFLRVREKYPTSPFAAQATERIRMINEQLYAYDQKIAAFYNRQNLTEAASQRASVEMEKEAVVYLSAPIVLTSERKEPVIETKVSEAEPIIETRPIRVVCSNSRVLVYLPSPIRGAKPEILRTPQGTSVMIPGLEAKKVSESCATVEGDKIFVPGASNPLVMPLENPPRLLVQG